MYEVNLINNVMYIVGRWSLTPYFMKTSPYCVPPFSKFCPPSHLLCCLPPHTTTTRHQVCGGLTHCGFLLVLLFDTTHKHTCTTHTAHSGAIRLTYLYKYIFTPPVMYSQQLSFLQWMNNSLIIKNLLSTMSFLFKYYSLAEVIYLLIRCYKT